MRSGLRFFAAACCLVAAGAVVNLHGFERALGHDDWQYRPALIAAYSREVVFRAGPCILMGLVAWFGRSGWLAATALVVAFVSVTGAYLTVQRYIVSPPGQLMPTLVWDYVGALLWVATVVLVLTVIFNGRMRRV
jgi:hypothetical protein